jgi:hypothetical protein
MPSPGGVEVRLDQEPWGPPGGWSSSTKKEVPAGVPGRQSSGSKASWASMASTTAASTPGPAESPVSRRDCFIACPGVGDRRLGGGVPAAAVGDIVTLDVTPALLAGCSPSSPRPALSHTSGSGDGTAKVHDSQRQPGAGSRFSIAPVSRLTYAAK